MLLPRSSYARDALEVAPELLGALIKRGGVTLRITEVEAYRWPDDTACHARHGRTERNAALWGPPGTAYVYVCYGMHMMLNLVTGKEGEAQAVLIRACEPVRGLATIRRRRGGLSGRALLDGPGKVGAALALDLSFSGRRVYERGPLEVHRGEAPAAILRGPRVGIDYALKEHREAHWRFAAAGTAWVSRPLPSPSRRRRGARRTRRGSP
ncbi:MAG TPA: DNA-3-methyladenine glycosylase [Planctomycetota bacterium]|nr:DNA-3-methyladenine glycosylase [Planctomycetota bacterium]